MTASRDVAPERLAGRASLLLAPLLLYLALAVLLTLEVWADPAGSWVGRCCDQQQAIWFLRWIPTVLERGGDPFFTAQMNAPTGVNMMWNSAMPIVSLALTPVTLAFGPVVAYNVAIVLAMATAAWAAYLALRRVTHGVLGPIVGGAIYGFSPYMVGHATIHLNLIIVWAPPLLLLLLHELLVRRRHGPALLGSAIGVLAGVQVLIFEEILATGAIAATVFAVVLALVVRDREAITGGLRRIALAAVPCAIAFALIAAWPLAAQFLGPQRIESPVQDAARYATDLANLVLPTPNQYFAPEAVTGLSREFSSLYHEATGYVGLPLLLVLVAVAVVGRHDRRLQIGIGVAASMFVLSLGPRLIVATTDTGIPLPWLPFAHLPLIEHALPGRLTAYVWLAIAGVVAVAIDELQALGGRRAVAGLAAIVVALVALAPMPPGTSDEEIPPFFARWDDSRVDEDAIALVAPHFTNGAGAAPMLWSAVAGNRPRLYEAYAYVPRADGAPAYGPPATQLTKVMERIQDDGVLVVTRGEVRAQVLREIEERRITHVIVGPMRYRDLMVAFFTDLLERQPEEVDGVQLWELAATP